MPDEWPDFFDKGKKKAFQASGSGGEEEKEREKEKEKEKGKKRMSESYKEYFFAGFAVLCALCVQVFGGAGV